MRLGHWFSYGDCRHWQLDLGRFTLYRWCPGAPCRIAGVGYRVHWVKVRIWNRRDTARTR